jgi:hypothetical protein
MTQYIVHLYREMKLSYTDIEADTPQAAAAIAGGKPTSNADNIEDCEGQNLAALVDTAGDEDYSQSVTVEFEPERIRHAAAKLLAALEGALPYAESEHASLLECWKRDGESVSELEAERCGGTIDKARAAIAETKTASISPEPARAERPSRFEFTHELEEEPDRAYVLVDGRYNVAIIRTSEGIVIDVYPKDWDDRIDTLAVWDEEVADAWAEAEADASVEA